MGRKGTRYSDEFKAEAVNLVKKEGYSMQKAADRLGVHAGDAAHGRLLGSTLTDRQLAEKTFRDVA